jgi:hypothetical protein
LALLLAFGCQFTGLAVAYALSRSAAFADTLSRSVHSGIGDNGRLAVAFGIGLAIQAVLSIGGYFLWLRRQATR